jgi:anti-anti-sigma regulatory factor
MRARHRQPGMLKIQRSTNAQTVFTLTGRIEAEDVKNLKQVLTDETEAHELVLDLKDVTLVNREAVDFLARCQAGGITLENCPSYIQKWIEQVRYRPKRRRTG